MAVKNTPVCEFGFKAPDFRLLGTDGKFYTLESCAKEHGIVVMFICTHCPYDPKDYPEDSFENMKKLAQEFALPFPYLVDETQAVAKAYGAVCTPDFFGFNAAFELQYRGRLDENGIKPAPKNAKRELVEAMRSVAATGQGPREQIASQGCSIKWISA